MEIAGACLAARSGAGGRLTAGGGSDGSIPAGALWQIAADRGWSLRFQ